MPYKDEVQKQIKELEDMLQQENLISQERKTNLERMLQNLRKSEFEEELRESENTQQLLKG